MGMSALFSKASTHFWNFLGPKQMYVQPYSSASSWHSAQISYHTTVFYALLIPALVPHGAAFSMILNLLVGSDH